MAEPPVLSKTLTFALLPDGIDRRVHAVYDPADAFPLSLCGLNIFPDLYLPKVVILCRRCMAFRPDNATFYSATSERRARARPAASLPAELGRWWRCHFYDRRIRRAVAVEQRRVPVRRHLTE